MLWWGGPLSGTTLLQIVQITSARRSHSYDPHRRQFLREETSLQHKRETYDSFAGHGIPTKGLTWSKNNHYWRNLQGGQSLNDIQTWGPNYEKAKNTHRARGVMQACQPPFTALIVRRSIYAIIAKKKRVSGLSARLGARFNFWDHQPTWSMLILSQHCRRNCMSSFYTAYWVALWLAKALMGLV